MIKTQQNKDKIGFGMVEIRGVEPLTFSMPLRRSTN